MPEHESRDAGKAIDQRTSPSLSDRELALDKQSITTYSQPRRVKAWVRVGPQPARVNALLLRSNDTTVGTEFTFAEKTYRCWVWGNAVELAGQHAQLG